MKTIKYLIILFVLLIVVILAMPSGDTSLHGILNWKGQDWPLTSGYADPGNNYRNNTGARIDNQPSGVNTYPLDGVLNWKGQDWYLTSGYANPGNNYWNNTGAWIDDQDRLHLTVVNDSGTWKSTMLNSQNTYCYGTFTWNVASPVFTFGKNCVVGLCTYLDDYNASNVVISRWGDPNGNQLWYYKESSTVEGNSKEYLVSPSIEGANTTYRIEWKPNYIRFTSMQADGTVIADYNNTNSSTIPKDPESVIMNLWLVAPPSDGRNIELIISNFTVTND